jgi:hypothetical protein
MIILRAIAAISPNSTLWDAGKGAVPSFGARRQKGEAVAYMLKYRTNEGGNAGKRSGDMARLGRRTWRGRRRGAS